MSESASARNERLSRDRRTLRFASLRQLSCSTALVVAACLLSQRAEAQVVAPIRAAPPEVIRSPQPAPNHTAPGSPVPTQRPHASAPPQAVAPQSQVLYPGVPPGALLQGPILSNSGPRPPFPTATNPATDRPLPINLATALRLSNGRPLVIALAQARVQIAAAQLERANVLWLPTAAAGANYTRHGGGIQSLNGNYLDESTNSFIAGGGAILRVATTDAIFEPLAARQVLRSRRNETQAARNLALKNVAESYFTVQMARGTYAAMTDATERSAELVRRVRSLAGGLVAPDEIDRAETQFAQLQQYTELAKQQWRVSSAELTRVLRLDPAAVVVPLEPDHLQVTLISSEWLLDDLIIEGLQRRPELAANRALVQANLIRLRQERLRPLVPSILVTGNGTPDFFFQGGVYGTGSGNSMNQWGGRADVAAQAIWQLENLGFGYQAKVRQQRGEVQLATVELFKVQDTVAAEVTQAKADVDSAVVRVAQAETGVKQALSTYSGNLRGMGQTQRFNDILSLINRPQEVVAALTQLQQAYVNYYATVADYNRAQFRLFYALGFPAEQIACARPPGNIEPVDTYRGPALPNVLNR